MSCTEQPSSLLFLFLSFLFFLKSTSFSFMISLFYFFVKFILPSPPPAFKVVFIVNPPFCHARISGASWAKRSYEGHHLKYSQWLLDFIMQKRTSSISDLPLEQSKLRCPDSAIPILILKSHEKVLQKIFKGK